jgi:HAD superfamily phosphoserine phosphatase-like hydrolase
MKFIFDLDGTVTAQETLPLMAKCFGVQEEISNLTKETIQGNVPFVESFIRRVHILRKLPVTDVANLLEQVALHSKVYEFIQAHKEDCIIATCNLDCWVEKLANRIGCQCYTSKAKVENNKVVSIVKILNKEQVVKKYQDLGEKVTFVGDGNNDMEAMRMADVAIAAGLTHHPANSIMSFTDYLIFDEKAICRQLNQLF